MIVQILIFLVCFSCGNLQQEKQTSVAGQQQDKFYTSSKDGDLYRIPLIKPVQVISAIGYGDDWVIKFPYQQLKNKRSVEVSSVAVVDSLIIVYSAMTALPGEMTQAWFLIDTEKETEKVYRNVEAYRKGLIEVGIKEEPQLYEVNELYKQFKEEKTLPFRRNSPPVPQMGK